MDEEETVVWFRAGDRVQSEVQFLQVWCVLQSLQLLHAANVVVVAVNLLSTFFTGGWLKPSKLYATYCLI